MRDRSTTRPGYRRFLVTLLLASGVLILGCGDGATGPEPGPQPVPGQLVVDLSGGSASAGAIVITVTGPAISSPAAPAGTSVYYDLSAGTLRAAVVGTALGDDVLRFAVPDVNQAASYQVTLQQAAGTSNEVLSTSGFTVAVTR
jgi:hypothetical protein